MKTNKYLIYGYNCQYSNFSPLKYILRLLGLVKDAGWYSIGTSDSIRITVRAKNEKEALKKAKKVDGARQYWELLESWENGVHTEFNGYRHKLLETLWDDLPNKPPVKEYGVFDISQLEK